MIREYKIATWNANGLARSQELKMFLNEHNIDILLISETHFTEKSFFKCPSYIIYDTKYPSERAHGGTAVIVKNKIRHHENPKYTTERMQST